MLSESPRIFIHRKFLTDEECEYFIQEGVSLLEDSLVAGANGSPVPSNVRTSTGAFLPRKPFFTEIEKRISLWTQIPPEHGENFHLLKYQDGQEYKPHFDFFDPDLPGMRNFLGKPGQRTATVLLYLETPILGGETIFPVVNLKVPAVKGDAVLFWSHTVEHTLDRKSMHGGLPVEQGIKYVATKWIRENVWS